MPVHRAERDAIDIVYKNLQRDRQQADISDIIRKLHEVVDDAIDVRPLAVFDLLKKPDLSGSDIRRIKQVAVELLRTLKTEKLRVDQ